MDASDLSVRVTRKSIEAVDICTFELIHGEGKSLPAFSAGSHIDVHMPNGVTRQYSLCNDPSEGHRYLIGVLRDPDSRGGSRTMHETVAEGDTLRISAPKNHFPLAHEATHSVLLAGGIGVTPILCMAERLAMTAASFEMHYCTRSRERTAFHGRIASSAFASRVQFHFDDGPPDQKLELQSLVAAPRPGVHLYVCGPKGFMDAVLNAARAGGWPAAQLHYEFFSAGPHTSADDAGFEVKVASSGKIVRVAKDQTVVKALAAWPGPLAQEAAGAIRELVTENKVAVQEVGEWMVVELNAPAANTAVATITALPASRR